MSDFLIEYSTINQPQGQRLQQRPTPLTRQPLYPHYLTTLLSCKAIKYVHGNEIKNIRMKYFLFSCNKLLYGCIARKTRHSRVVCYGLEEHGQLSAETAMILDVGWRQM